MSNHEELLSTIKSQEDLLKLTLKLSSIENKQYESQCTEMSEDNKKFLDLAFSSCFVDLTKKMIELLGNLNKSPLITNQTDCSYDYSQDELILEELADFCEDIDLAKDFFKIGGVDIVLKLLNSQHHEILHRTCYLVACCCKNNIFMQKVFYDQNILQILLDLFLNEKSTLLIKLQSLSAVSSIINNFVVGLEAIISKYRSQLKNLINFSLKECEDISLSKKCLFFLRNIALTSGKIFEENFHEQTMGSNTDIIFNVSIYLKDKFEMTESSKFENTTNISYLVSILASFIQSSQSVGQYFKMKPGFVKLIKHVLQNMDQDEQTH